MEELWKLYCDYRKSQVAATTFKKEYLLKFTNHIQKLPTRDLDQAVVIRDYLLATTSTDTTKRILTRFSACCDWAVKSGMLKDNPFVGMAVEIKLKNKQESDLIDPFSVSERDAILKAFQEHPNHRHYYPFVRFMFLTGCRTGEAIALQWKHIY